MIFTVITRLVQLQIFLPAFRFICPFIWYRYGCYPYLICSSIKAPLTAQEAQLDMLNYTISILHLMRINVNKESKNANP